MPARPFIVGLISDTHNLVRPEATKALAGVDHIQLPGRQRDYPVRGGVDHDGRGRRAAIGTILGYAGALVALAGYYLRPGAV